MLSVNTSQHGAFTMSRPTPSRAPRFFRNSAICGLLLGAQSNAVMPWSSRALMSAPCSRSIVQILIAKSGLGCLLNRGLADGCAAHPVGLLIPSPCMTVIMAVLPISESSAFGSAPRSSAFATSLTSHTHPAAKRASSGLMLYSFRYHTSSDWLHPGLVGCCASDLSGSSAPPLPALPTTRLFSTLQAFGCDGSEQGILSLGDELPTFEMSQPQSSNAFSYQRPT